MYDADLVATNSNTDGVLAELPSTDRGSLTSVRSSVLSRILYDITHDLLLVPRNKLIHSKAKE